jgi:cobyrinic acid a,c-diamide synthase
MSALTKRGLRVQGFKVGPDYIDPSYHTHVTNRLSRNLDTYMLNEGTMMNCFLKASVDSDISVIEGVMGLFDGVNGTSDRGTTASVAKLLKAPVVLVLDVWSSARSAAASVLGFSLFDRKVNLAGVVLNRVAGQKHAESCTQAIEKGTKVRVLGWLPKSDDIHMPERHLGLIPSVEKRPQAAGTIEKLGEFIEEHLDLDRVVRVARSAPPSSQERTREISQERETRATIGVAMDEAFSFYYADALDLLRDSGAEIVRFSPIHDSSLPDNLDGLYIGGGFPEVYAEALEQNSTMRQSVMDRIQDGMPTFVECGGLMYLTKSITGFDGRSNSMVGVLETSTTMKPKLTLGYTLAHSVTDSILSKAGESLRGHEYHFSEVGQVPGDASLAYEMRRGRGISDGREGWQVYNALACYSHTHFCSRPRTASRFVDACVKYSRR